MLNGWEESKIWGYSYKCGSYTIKYPPKEYNMVSYLFTKDNAFEINGEEKFYATAIALGYEIDVIDLSTNSRALSHLKNRAGYWELLEATKYTNCTHPYYKETILDGYGEAIRDCLDRGNKLLIMYRPTVSSADSEA